MKRDKFENYLGKMVEIELSTGRSYRGVLHKCDDGFFSRNPSIHYRPNYYVLSGKDPIVVMSPVFRLMHVRKIYEVQQ